MFITNAIQAKGSGGPHLHIEFWKNKSPNNKVDPKQFFNSKINNFGKITNPCN